jgi:hypothetical protein
VLRYTSGTLGLLILNNRKWGFNFKDKRELKSGSENIKQVVVFDMLGRKLFEKGL